MSAPLVIKQYVTYLLSGAGFERKSYDMGHQTFRTHHGCP